MIAMYYESARRRLRPARNPLRSEYETHPHHRRQPRRPRPLAAAEIAAHARAAIAARGRFTFAISGGSLRQDRLPALHPAARHRLDRGLPFFADDRFVEHDNPYSNYALADDAIFSRQPACRARHFPHPRRRPHSAAAADRYDRTIRAFFKLRSNQWPRLDLAQLGSARRPYRQPLPAQHCPQRGPPHRRHEPRRPGILGGSDYPDHSLFNHGRSVLFLAHGSAKRDVFRRILKGPPNPRLLPASAIGSKTTRVIWMGRSDLAGDAVA